jgi:hypothetical protein
MKRAIRTIGLAISIVALSASAVIAAQPPGATGHGKAVSEVARAVESLSDMTHGERVSALAKTHGAAVSALAKAQGAAASAAGKANGASADAAAQGQGQGAVASEPGRLKAAAAGQAHQP